MNTLYRSVALLALVGATTSCRHLEGDAQAAPAKSAAPPRAASQDSLVDLIPAKARVALIVRKSLFTPVQTAFFSSADMMRELQPFLERSFGIDLTRIEGLVAFNTDIEHVDEHVGLILRIPTGGGALKLPAAGDAGGTPMYTVDKGIVCARLKAGLVIGSEIEVRAAVAVERGKEPALSRDSGLGKLLATDAGEIDAVAAVGPGALPKDKVMGVEDAILLYRRSGAIELTLHGDPAQLGVLRGIAVTAIQAALVSLQQEKDKAVATNDALKGSSAIIAYYQAKKLAAELDPKLEGNALKVRYQLPDMNNGGGSTMMVATAGVLAAVAVPAFQKYIARSKTVEATMNLRKLSDSIAALGTDSPKKLAALRATDWTPKTGCCGQPGNKCAPDASAWSGATWRALDFSIADPHFYQYRVQIEGKGAKAKYSFEARGDLDCDSKFSSFHRTVTFGPNGPNTGAGLESSDDTE